MVQRIFEGELADGYSIKTFAIREKVTGDMPAIYSMISRLYPEIAKAGTGDAYQSVSMIETIRHLLVSVDGVDVNKSGPYMALSSWSEATVGAVAEAYFNAFKAPEGKSLASGEVRLKQ